MDHGNPEWYFGSSIEDIKEEKSHKSTTVGRNCKRTAEIGSRSSYQFDTNDTNDIDSKYYLFHTTSNQ